MVGTRTADVITVYMNSFTEYTVFIFDSDEMR